MFAAVQCHRPPKFYLYSQRQSLERCLTAGEFRLQPAAQSRAGAQSGNDQILPFRTPDGAAPRNYLTLSLATVWDAQLFNAFPGADCCLIIHNAEDFGERVHRAAQRALPNWAGIDAAISYGVPSPLGAAFSKPGRTAREQEWLFAWRPMQASLALHPIVIRIGSIEAIAELRAKKA